MLSGPFTTYLFDLDGTLIDSIALILSSFRHTLQAHRGSVPPDATWLEGLGTPLRSQFSRFARDADELDAMIATYRTHNLAHHDQLVRPYPGVREAVEAVAVRARVGVVTSKSHAGAQLGLARCGLHHLFDVIVGADDVTRHKPDPEPVHRAMALLDGKPATTVFVGDASHDLRAGRAAGVQTAAALWGPFTRATLEPYAPDRWLARPADIATL